MMLKNLVIADPVGNVAELISTECRRLARHRVVATQGEQALNLVKEWRPEVLLLSLEIHRPDAMTLLPKVTATLPEVLILGTYRTLSEPIKEKLQRLGVDAFLAHPITAHDVYQVVSKRFSLPFRELQRFIVDCQVRRQGSSEPLGHLLDLSETGLRFECQGSVAADEVAALEVDLGDAAAGPLKLTCQILSVSERRGKTVARGKFVDLKGEAKQRLLSFVSGLTKKLNPLAY